MKTKTYVSPFIKVVKFYAECAGINIGSGNTTPEDCETNENCFEEEQTHFRNFSVWDK